MRCTHCASAMSPTHTRRRGRRYRYYVCLGASRRVHDTCSVRSVADGEIEALALAQVWRFLAAPEVAARTMTSMLEENGPIDDAMLEERCVIEALGALEPGGAGADPPAADRAGRTRRHLGHAAMMEAAE